MASIFTLGPLKWSLDWVVATWEGWLVGTDKSLQHFNPGGRVGTWLIDENGEEIS
jgi:hypothetical protein